METAMRGNMHFNVQKHVAMIFSQSRSSVRMQIIQSAWTLLCVCLFNNIDDNMRWWWVVDWMFNCEKQVTARRWIFVLWKTRLASRKLILLSCLGRSLAGMKVSCSWPIQSPTSTWRLQTKRYGDDTVAARVLIVNISSCICLLPVSVSICCVGKCLAVFVS